MRKRIPEKAALLQQANTEVHPERPLAYRMANRDKAAVRSKAYKQGNPERVREDTRRWFAANTCAVHKWRKATRRRLRAQTQRRKARMANAEGTHTSGWKSEGES